MFSLVWLNENLHTKFHDALSTCFTVSALHTGGIPNGSNRTSVIRSDSAILWCGFQRGQSLLSSDISTQRGWYILVQINRVELGYGKPISFVTSP